MKRRIKIWLYFPWIFPLKGECGHSLVFKMSLRSKVMCTVESIQGTISRHVLILSFFTSLDCVCPNIGKSLLDILVTTMEPSWRMCTMTIISSLYDSFGCRITELTITLPMSDLMHSVMHWALKTLISDHLLLLLLFKVLSSLEAVELVSEAC